MRVAKYFGIISICFCYIGVVAQADDFRKKFEEFKDKTKTEYNNFRDKANKEYAEFMQNAWKQVKMMPAVPRPEEKQVPPIVLENELPLPENNPLPIEETIVPSPQPDPQPMPLAPIYEHPVERERRVSFYVFGTEMSVRFADELSFTLTDCKEKNIANAWKRLSSEKYNNTIWDCLELRIARQLNDWAYFQMLCQMSAACMPDENAATLLTAYIYCQSGYKMRLAKCDGKLEVLCSSKHTIYNHSSLYIDGEYFYYFGQRDANSFDVVNVCEAVFPQEKPMSLMISNPMDLAIELSELRTLKSNRYSTMHITVNINKNLTSFFDSYPSSCVDNNFMTRWAMYANFPLDSVTRNSLYPQLQAAIDGCDELGKVDRLLNWVQTAFEYEYDEKVWGYDRAFFAEETLYYPFCDCEDRSILFSRLVRDLLGLKVILVYYPGHLATAVLFTDDVAGDYILLNNEHYVVCDPTYINAGVGRTMPGMDNNKAKVILLN